MTQPSITSTKKQPQVLRGWKVMAWDDQADEAVSGADRRQRLPSSIGMEVSMPLPGIWLSLDRQHVIDHYAVHDRNVLIGIDFHPDAVVRGNLTDRETEFTVSGGILAVFELLPDEDV